MAVPAIIWIVFLFALGACIGSFLNVVVYRLPRGMSLVMPGSHCTSCDKPISWYDNLPIIAWFILRGKCRYCGAKFSVRYPAVELFTALMFVALFYFYFIEHCRYGLPAFEKGGSLIYAGHIFLLGVLLASSLIDAELMIIDLSLTWAAIFVGLALSCFWPYLMPFTIADANDQWRIIPYASPQSGSWAIGAMLGLALRWLLLKKKIIKEGFADLIAAEEKAIREGTEIPEIEVNARKEILLETLSLLPVLILGWLALAILGDKQNWADLLAQNKWLPGLLGSIFGTIIGGAVVWVTRILGTLGFGREAMGLGDVDLMAAVGAVLGWQSPVIAFFVAPFVGLGWALAKLIFHRKREIPYGPFLSLATFIVMISHDRIVAYFENAFTPPPLP